MRCCRRTWLSTVLPTIAAVGCSKSTRSKSAKRRGPGSLANRPKGPQGFGSMMAKEWAKDLGDKSPEKRVRAATELANMGSAAASALPALEQAAKDTNPQVRAAAKQALVAIRKK